MPYTSRSYAIDEGGKYKDEKNSSASTIGYVNDVGGCSRACTCSSYPYLLCSTARGVTTGRIPRRGDRPVYRHHRPYRRCDLRASTPWSAEALGL